MQTISSIFASEASIIASLAKAGGTKIIDTLALVFDCASSTELKTGIFCSRINEPPFPGVTPATILLP